MKCNATPAYKIKSRTNPARGDRKNTALQLQGFPKERKGSCINHLVTDYFIFPNKELILVRANEAYRPTVVPGVEAAGDKATIVNGYVIRVIATVAIVVRGRPVGT